jgi:NAD(P)-dependent dehydrogenase (short-subunit alcohol dehydrogenase family)
VSAPHDQESTLTDNGLFDLSGRVAVVTGGSRGIGLGIARGFRDAGADVSIWARDTDVAAAAAAEIGAHAVTCDVQDQADVDRALEETLARHGRVDVAALCAGRPASLVPFLELTKAQWDGVIDTNLGGIFLTSQAIARHMANRGGGGKLILISSLRVTMGAPMSADYAASKGGVESFLRSVAVALAPHGIQVNAVRPGWIATEMTSSLWTDPLTDASPSAAILAGRWGLPSDFVGVTTYLASPASDFHTGDVITIDGGLTANSGGGVSAKPKQD